FIDTCEQTLGADWKKFFPLVMSLFLFVAFSNLVSVIPGVKSPTADLNTCLGLGLLVFFIAHISAVRKKGIVNYIKSYFQPIFFLFPLNVIGEIGKVISHSFRLFGNLFAGGIILALAVPIVFKVTGLLHIPKLIVSPGVVAMLIVLQGFFGLFVGLIQAFVFSMLALTYIAVLRED
ncbi:MAG TPA: ATP synthase F0 subunit A, partial [Candidatus Omnitrophica bacterium]|nr:ATP synthase F0 subunit A [Candidatus Omnitrophota bacterium]